MLIRKTGSTATIVTKADAPAGTFSGYGSTFGNRDVDDDVIERGAFAKSLAEHASKGSLPRLLWQHDRTNPIGQYTAMREDDHGLWLEGQLWVDEPADAEALKAYRLMKSPGGAGLSIGFYVEKEEIDRNTGIRKIHEARLVEVSVVSFPANPLANTVGVKAAGEIKTVREFEAWLRDAGGFSRDAAKAIAAGGWKARGDARDEPPGGGDDSREATATALEKLARSLEGIRAA